MDKVMKNITRVRHPKLLPLTYGHGQSHEKYGTSTEWGPEVKYTCFQRNTGAS